MASGVRHGPLATTTWVLSEDPRCGPLKGGVARLSWRRQDPLVGTDRGVVKLAQPIPGPGCCDQEQGSVGQLEG